MMSAAFWLASYDSLRHYKYAGLSVATHNRCRCVHACLRSSQTRNERSSLCTATGFQHVWDHAPHASLELLHQSLLAPVSAKHRNILVCQGPLCSR